MYNDSVKYDVIIAGAGPAGTSAAIHLANRRMRVLLVEQRKFPRAKLCGEFISPECRTHFQELGVDHAMMSSGPALITKTVFYSRQGHHVTVPSRSFGFNAALGLSRAIMDDVLLRRAQESGVDVLENTTVTDLLEDNNRVLGARLRTDEHELDVRAPITIDATGRARVLARKLKSHGRDTEKRSRPKLIAFKTHLQKTRVSKGACEIYFYPGGYGGLSTVDAGFSNLCFIVMAKDVQRCRSKPEVVLRDIVMRNKRARYTLECAELTSEWLSASWERFGRQQPAPAPGLLAIGDSAAFIDPFTGSGMLMALESGRLVAEVIVRHGDKLSAKGSFESLTVDYATEYRRKFDSRLRFCGLLRRVALSPRFAEFGIAICSVNGQLRNRIARATRANNTENPNLGRVG
jgi:flavin-dependent dehydrogenase